MLKRSRNHRRHGSSAAPAGPTRVCTVALVIAALLVALLPTDRAAAQQDLMGDVDCSGGEISLIDARLAALVAIGALDGAADCSDAAAPTDGSRDAADVDANGDISLFDARLIALCAIGAPDAAATGFCTPELDPAANLALILANGTRNTVFDDNEFRDVPMSQIGVSDLTVPGDLYNEALLDTTNSGYFRVKCEFSHFAYDDPIVFPDEPGRAHLHMFFGNTNANAYSTFESLLNSGTGTCNGEDLNRTAYWVPALLNSSGQALIPFEIMVYYKNDNFRLNGANELVEPFPDNLRMVVGNAMATEPQTELSGDWGQPIVQFACGPAYNAEYQSTMPDCYGTGNGPYGNRGRALEMQISFPQCFNPDLGTYVPGGAHMSYSIGGYYGSVCPDSHPYDISSIMYRIFFSPDDYGGALENLRLSSDVRADGTILPGGTTVHADWFGAWHPGAMDLWVQNCNNSQADCEIGLLSRQPAISLVPRDESGIGSGYLADPVELLELCPTKTFDPADPVRSVALCTTG